MTTLSFYKGHGTENDFVLLPDASGEFTMTPEMVQALTDRHAGIGGDGVIRIIRTDVLVAQGLISEDLGGDTQWFMDYYNADGSVAEMCGNGVRVFAHFLVSQGLESHSEFSVGTRAGVRSVTVHSADDHEAMVSVGMGKPVLRQESTVSLGGHTFNGQAVDVGNPHLVAVEESLTPEQLDRVSLVAPVMWDPEVFPDGTNIEITTALKNDEIHMRVYERGVGETRSCGTGTVAAALAAVENSILDTADSETAARKELEQECSVTVHIPGGSVQITLGPDQAILTGPSRLVFTGEFPYAQ